MDTISFDDIRGMDSTIAAVKAAVAARQSILLVGSPGSGKTMIARRIPTIMPALSDEAAFTVAKIYARVGMADRGIQIGRTRRPPLRAPHHTVSEQGLLGALHGVTHVDRGRVCEFRPGEYQLAHAGVLFLDEAPELPGRVLYALRDVRRFGAHVAYPHGDRPLLVGASSPCGCGWYRHPMRACTCPPAAIERYRARVRGNLFDVEIEVPSVSIASIMEGRTT